MLMVTASYKKGKAAGLALFIAKTTDFKAYLPRSTE